eukprot:GHUV01017083.1.p1 GENE.GHUV01017083.1~~GHUV01017083.1.p1  ORF type:complete len:269 (+),score=61.79 GHUV01017083.1:739-1545(+)
MLLGLPSECILNILKHVGVADVIATGGCCRVLQTIIKDDKFWQDLSEAKWGQAVTQLKPLAEICTLAHEEPTPAVGQADFNESLSWFTYASKRMCLKSIRSSPLSLIQEDYPDPWQHIICCVLCSRTSGSARIRSTIAAFFSTFPTPTTVLEADVADITAVIHPLGLQPTRLAAVKAVSHDFLATDWQEPSQFKGCGKFVADSWKVFCKGHRVSRGIHDVKLTQYLAWVNRWDAQEQGGCHDHKPQAQVRQQHHTEQKPGSHNTEART